MKVLTTNRGFWSTFLLTIITLGFYGLYLNHCYAAETNLACKEDGKHTRGLLGLIGLSIITFGIYSFVWSWNLQNRRHDFLLRANQPSYYSGLKSFCYSYLLSWTFICPLLAFLYTIYQQNGVNKVYNAQIGA